MSAIRDALRREGIPIDPRHCEHFRTFWEIRPSWFRRPTRKLTDDQILEIRRRVKAGEKQVDVGRDYGIGQPSVSAICRFMIYADVPDRSAA